MPNAAKNTKPVVRLPRPSETGNALRAASRSDNQLLVIQRINRFCRARTDVWRVWEKFNKGRGFIFLGYVRGPSSEVGKLARAEWPDKVGRMEIEPIFAST